MALIGELIIAISRENLRQAIVDESYRIGKQLGLTNPECSTVATKIIQKVESTEVEPN